MTWLIGGWQSVWTVAAKAVLMYATAVVALRLGERRTLAQWTIIDFATAVAMGAIIGRTAIADGQSYLAGAVAVVSLVTVHRLASLLRYWSWSGKLFDHRIRILVRDGHIQTGQLRRCGLTDNDLYAQLRQRGVFRLDDVALVLYETKGSVTIVPRDAAPGGDLIRRGLRDAVPADDR